MKSTIKWKGNMQFEAIGDASGRSLVIDGPEKSGGENLGPRPMELVLHAIGGCTGIDIVNTLDKMRLHVEEYEMEIEGARAEDHPKRYTDIHIVYKFKGDLPEPKVRRAIDLSKNKYCSVSQSLNANVTYSFEINGEKYTEI